MISLDKYDIIDLTHEIYHEMPGWPTHPNLIIEDLRINNRDGYAVKQIVINTHHGTHIDVQAHMKYKGKTLNEYPLTTFIGEGVVLDLSYKADDEEISDEDLRKFDSVIKDNDMVMLHTGWDKYRSFDTRYLYHWPYLGISGAKYLVSKHVKAVGTEGLSIGAWGGSTPVQGAVAETSFEVHRILLDGGTIIVEEMANLAKVLKGKPYARAFFIILPLNIREADGSPVRAIALVERGG